VGHDQSDWTIGVERGPTCSWGRRRLSTTHKLSRPHLSRAESLTPLFSMAAAAERGEEGEGEGGVGDGQGRHVRSAAAPATAISSGPSVCMTLANMSNGVFRELASMTDRSMPPSSSIIFTTPLRRQSHKKTSTIMKKSNQCCPAIAAKMGALPPGGATLTSAGDACSRTRYTDII
jgi:hypothetical protein